MKLGFLVHLWKSPWTHWVGFRYLKSRKSSRFLSFITILSVMGVAIGVTALIVVMSVMDGFESELKKRLMSSDLHLLISPRPELPSFESGFVHEDELEKTGAMNQLLEDDRVQKVWPIVSAEAILRSGTKVTGVVLKGVTEEKLENVKKLLSEEAAPGMLFAQEGKERYRLPGVLIGQELGYMIGLIPGDRVMLISPTETQGPLESVPRMRQFVVEGIYSSGLPEQELHTVFSADQEVRSFLRKRNVVSNWEILVEPFDAAPEVAANLRSKTKGLVVRDWIQLNSNLFASLRLERIAMFVILAFIIIVASFNIVTTLTLMVLEKKKEISILKAMGARRSQVAAIFLSEGLLIGIVGVGGGSLLAFVLCQVLKNYEFIQLPDIYYDRTLPVTFDPLYYALVSVAAVGIVLAACLYPSGRAARLHPLEGIREN